MSPTTTYQSKPARGETTVNLACDRVLRIVTAKDSAGHLTTRATVAKLEGNMMVYALFADLNERLVRSTLRATDGNVRRQHESILTNMAHMVRRAEAFYAQSDGRRPPEHAAAVENASRVPT